MLVWSKKKYYRQPKQNSWKNAVSFLLIIVMVCVYGGGMHSGGHMIQNVFFKQNESPGASMLAVIEHVELMVTTETLIPLHRPLYARIQVF